MRKVIKILLSVFSYLLLALIVVPLFVSMLLFFPAVQNMLAHKAARWASAKLNTTVAIDNINFRLFNRFEVNGVYVEDLHGDTLLYVKHLSVNVKNLGLFSGKIGLGDVNLDTGLFFLHEVSPKVMNISELLDPLKSDSTNKKSSNFALDAASCRISGVRYRMVLDSGKRRGAGPEAIDFSDLAVSGIALEGSNLSIRNDSIHFSIQKFAFREKSGFRVDNLSTGKFDISSRGMLFRDMTIATPLSRIHFDYMNMLYDKWLAYTDFINQVRFDAHSTGESTFDFRTISPFAPPMKSWNIPLTGVIMTVKGPVSNMYGTVGSADSENTRIRGLEFAFRGLPDVPATRFEFTVDRLTTTGSDIGRIVGSITGKQPLPPDLLARFSPYGLTGRFTGRLSDFRATASLNTAHGDANVDIRIAPERNAMSVDGSLDVRGIDVGLAAGNPDLGALTARATLNGTIGKGNTHLRTNARLDALAFKGYTYNRMTFDGNLDNSVYTGRINCTDPNLDFDADGAFDPLDTVPRYNASFDLRRADLVRLHLNRRDSVSVLSCQLRADASGHGIDDLNGTLTLDKVLYVNERDTIHTDLVTLTSQNSPSLKHLKLTSPFADAEYYSRKSYKDLARSLMSTLKRYIPTPEDRTRVPFTPATPLSENGNRSIVLLKVKEANDIADALVPGLKIASGTDMKITYNIATEQLEATLRSDSMAYNHLFASGIDLSARNPADTMLLSLKAGLFSYGGIDFPQLFVTGAARDNRINLVAGYYDAANRSSARIGINSHVQVGAGATRVQMELTQSQLVNKSRTWEIAARNIYYDTTRVAIEGLRIASRSEALLVDGVLSRSRDDTLHVRMEHLDLYPLSRFTEGRGFTVGGIAEGRADIVSGLRGALLYANIAMDSLSINNVAIPPLVVDSRWDTGRQRARGAVVDRVRGDTLAVAYYYPAERRYRGRATLDNVDLSLIDPILKGVLRGTSGKADVRLQLSGQGNRPVLDGSIAVRNMATTVDFTNVPYTVPQANIAISNSNFTLPSTPVHDGEGNSGTLEMAFTTTYLSNLAFNINVRPDRMLVMNTNASLNDLFFGRVYASGQAFIRGDRSGVNMDVNAVTAGNSAFTLSLGNKSDFGQADFVVFKSRRQQEPEAKKGISFRESASRKGVAAQQQRAGGNVNVRLALDVRPNLEMQILLDPNSPDGLRARGNGNLNIRVNPATNEFSIYGDYTISEGSYVFNLQDVVRRTFTVAQGSTVTFIGDPMATLLDVTAIFSTKASIAPLVSGQDDRFNRNIPVDCKIHLTERISQPNIAFDIDVPNADPETRSIVTNALNTQEMLATQFVWLLATNSFYSDNSGANNIGTGLGEAGASIGANALLAGLTNLVNTSSWYSLGASYRPGTETTSNEIDIGLTVPVGKRGQIDLDSNVPLGSSPLGNGNSMSNFATDASFTYRLNRTGNLRARAFTRTITRFDENQGQQEGGLGIYYYDDFDKLSDIFRRRRNRSTAPGAFHSAARVSNVRQPADTTYKSDSTYKAGAIKADTAYRAPKIENPR